MKRCTIATLIIFTVIGILLVIAGITLIFESSKIIKNQIDQNVVLKNGSEAYKAWKDPPTDIYMQFWVFNVENPWQVIAGEAKPNVTQKGPYTYREIRGKESVEFLSNGTVISYRDPKTYVFDQNLSGNLSENDKFTTVNLPILTIAALLEKKVPRSLQFLLPLVSALLSLEKERLFEEHTVHEFLWGYKEPLLDKINNLTTKVLGYHFNTTVGLFTGPTHNGSDDGVYSIYSGTGDINQLNSINAWNGSPMLKYWKTPYCNMINGTDGSKWHPYINKDEVLYIFASDICRSIYVNFNKTNDVHGIQTYHFTPPPSVFMDHVHNPDNTGFCQPKCLESGVLDVSVCKGAPIIISQPHFYQGAQVYIDAIVGMHPEDEYSTLMDIEPYTGTALKVAKKLQLNAKVTKLRAFKDTVNFNLTIFPMLWLNESAQLGESDAGKFSAEVLRPMQILEGVQWAMLALGILILICVLVYIIQYKIRAAKQSEDPPLLSGDT